MIYLFIILFTFILNKNSYTHLKNKIFSYYNEYNEPLLKNFSLINNITSYYENFIKKYSNQTELNYDENPLISIIIPIFNGNKYILPCLLSIEAQTFKKIEIIFVDDFSMDNSIKIIETLQMIDKRIKLYKNKENKGILYTKSFGVKQAKGKYVIIMDQDDLYINKNLFFHLYNISEENNLDIIQYKNCKFFIKKKRLIFEKNLKTPNYNKIILQPELGNIKLFHNEKLFKSNYLWDKLIKKKIYLKVLDSIGEELLNKKIVHREDHIITFYLYKIANNYMRINLYGYLHIIGLNEQSSIFFHNAVKGKKIPQNIYENIVNDQFEFFKFLYLSTENNKEEKLVSINEIIKLTKHLNFCKKINNKKIRNLVINVCNMYINSKFIDIKKRKTIKKFLKFFIKKNANVINDL